MEYKVRPLQAQDLKTLVKMLGKLRTGVVTDIIALLKTDKGKPERSDKMAMETGLMIFRELSSTITDDLYAWLASLIGKTAAELDVMPFDTPIEIVKTMISGGGFKSFLSRVADAVKTPSNSSASTTEFSADTDGQTQK